jgi:phage repressor protein C with HTH and peptisase S24 domain
LSDRFDSLTEEHMNSVETELDFTLSQRLRAVVNHLGMAESVRVSDKSDKQLRRYMSGDEPPFSVLEKLSSRSSTSLDWLAHGECHTQNDRRLERAMLTDAISTRVIRLKQFVIHEPEKTMLEFGIACAEALIEILDQEVVAASNVIKNQDNEIDLRHSQQHDFIALPFLDIHASAGGGAVVPLHEETISVVSFERAFLRSLGANPDRCRIITARGDSMAPTIPDGALIIIDHSQREIVNGWISVVNVCGDLLVKRIRRRLDGTIELVSDNTIYPVETILPDRLDQLSIVGRLFLPWAVIRCGVTDMQPNKRRNDASGF